MESVLKKRKGGVRQRSQSDVQCVTYKSQLAEHLLKQMAWGYMSTVQVQTIANLALGDIMEAGLKGEQYPGLHGIAKAGTFGKRENNIHRDLMIISKTRCTLEPFEFNLMFEGVEDQVTTLMLPHALFSHLYHSYPASFKNRMLPDKAKLGNFWETAQYSAAAKLIPEVRQKCFQEWAIPLGIHGDEVPCVGVGKIWCKMALTFQWYSLMSAAAATPTLDLMMWIWACFEKILKLGVGGTIDAFFDIIKWSFSAMYEGRWPHFDHRGVRRHVSAYIYFGMCCTDMPFLNGRQRYL